MEFILDTNAYRNLARDLEPANIQKYSSELIEAENSLGARSALSIVVSMELIQHLQSSDPHKEECFKALCLQKGHTNRNGYDYYPPMNIILTQWLFGSNSKYHVLCEKILRLLVDLTEDQKIENCDMYADDVRATASQVRLEKEEFRKGIENFIRYRNNGDLNWLAIHNSKRERKALFEKIKKGEIEYLLAIGMMLRAHEIMEQQELLPEWEQLIAGFIGQFKAALRMNTLIFEKLGHGAKLADSVYWNTLNDTQILFGLFYRKDNTTRYLVSDDRAISKACTAAGLGNSILTVSAYKKMLGVD